jgi:glyoxylase-like metal-dependent hydrolase (beta-lactamase superfamily II)
MRRHGVPEDLVTALGLVADAFRPYGSGGHVERLLADGDELRLRDRTLKVLHRPGHSQTDILLWDAERRLVIGGDHLLAHISSNAMITRPRGEPDGERRRPLIDYIASLQATAELPAEIVLGGHGPPVHDHRGLIASRLRMHDRRATKIHRLLADGPLSAAEIALRMWGNVAVTQAFLTLSEVLGHADLLLRDGLVREVGDGDVVKLEAG